MFDARVIANEVLKRAWAAGVFPTNLSLQKILYFLHGHHLENTGKPLIATEFEAWEYGPVQRVAYQAFKGSKDEPIDQISTGFDPVRRVARPIPTLDDQEALSTIAEHLDDYLELPAFELVRITHEPGTPWSRVMQSSQESVNVGMRIPNESIVEAFEGLRNQKR